MTVKQRNRQAITRPKKVCKKCQQRGKELGAVESKLEKVKKVGEWAKMSVDDVHEEVIEEGSSNNKAMFADWVNDWILSINDWCYKSYVNFYTNCFLPPFIW